MRYLSALRRVCEPGDGPLVAVTGSKVPRDDVPCATTRPRTQQNQGPDAAPPHNPGDQMRAENLLIGGTVPKRRNSHHVRQWGARLHTRAP
jgi:hypothetical protein